MDENNNSNEIINDNLSETADDTAINDVSGATVYAVPSTGEIEETPFFAGNDDGADGLIKPEITLNDEPDEEFKRSSKSFKVFALILVAAILLVACFSGGYFLGKNSNKVAVTPGLSAKPNSNALSVEEVYNKVNPSVVGIVIYGSDGNSYIASGVVYSADGYIVTNDHIYSNVPNAKFKIILSDKTEVNAAYIAGDTRTDLAVLKANTSGLTAATFGNSNELTAGEDVVAIGRFGSAYEDSKITKGVVSLKSVRVKGNSTDASNAVYSETYIQTDTAINPGSSGGALCNMYGQVVGITSSKIVGDVYEGVNYSIPSAKMKKIVDSLIKNKYVDCRGKLSISYTFIDSVSAETTGNKRGLLVATVNKESTLYGKIGVGDIITAVNGKEIVDASVILDQIDELNPGDTLVLTVYTTKKKTETVTATLIPDKGSSSYTTKKSNDDTSSNYNKDTFDFPAGD